MLKIFCLFFIFFVIISWQYDVFSYKSLNIVSREEWWANEEFRFIDSEEWINILRIENTIRKNNKIYISEEDTILTLGTPDYNEKIEKYLSTFFAKELQISDVITQENWRKLFWPIEVSENIQAIVIHHTDWDYTDSYKSVREIYKFHTLDRKWWDIWYNFLISADWEIFEWRSGWENAVGAHNKWNNIWNIGIALMWNYSHENIPEKQVEALNNLSSYFIEKYKIDINKKVYFHEECKQENCEKEIYSELNFPMIAHRNSSDTSCPWEQWYADFLEIRKTLQQKYKIPEINIIKLEWIFDKYSKNNLDELLKKLIILKHKERNYKKKNIYNQVITILKNYLIKIDFKNIYNK